MFRAAGALYASRLRKITVALLLSASTTTAVKAETFFTTGQLMQNCATTLMLHDFGKWVHPDKCSGRFMVATSRAS
jgi:hypothetical protein